MTVQPIVEGHGEVEAAPELLRRISREAGLFTLQAIRPIRARRTDFEDEGKLSGWIKLARLSSPDAILILFDADDACPKGLAQKVSVRAKAMAHPIPCEVVIANREYEAWLLSAVESLSGHCGIGATAHYAEDPESPRDAKGKLSFLMAEGRKYTETTDQVTLTASFDMAAAYNRCRSFRRMISAMGQLMAVSDQPLSNWPPQHSEID